MAPDIGSSDGWVVIATIDEVHLEVLAEVMDDAGIAVRFEPVPAKVTTNAPPMVTRRLFEVKVEAARRADAEALLAEFTRSGAEAAEAQAEDGVAPDDESAVRGPLWRRALRWITGQPSPGGTDDGSHS